MSSFWFLIFSVGIQCFCFHAVLVRVPLGEGICFVVL